MLQELRELNLVSILLQLLVAISQAQGGEDLQNAPPIMGSILTTLTNLSLNDSNNVKIRLHGAHIIGQILMDNCPAVAKASKEHEKVYLDDPAQNIKIQHEL